MKIRIDELAHETIRFRVTLDKGAVREYAENPKAAPPIDVFAYDGATWIADGEHRVAAHLRAGLTDIEAVMHEGGRHAVLPHGGALV